MFQASTIGLVLAIAACQIPDETFTAIPPIDARSIDARSIDAPPPIPPTFAVAYASRADAHVIASISGASSLVVINIGTEALPVPELKIVSVSDDDPTAVFGMNINTPSTAPAAPGEVHGHMTQQISDLVAPLLVPGETWVEQIRPSVDFNLNNIPQGVDIDIHATAILGIGNQTAQLDYVFEIRNSGGGSSILAASRVNSKPL